MNLRQSPLILVLATFLLPTMSSLAATLNATYNAASDVPLTAGSYTATGNTVNFTLNCAPATGATLTVVKNTGLGFIDGTFDNLAQGQAVALSYGGVNYKFVANYYGGSGNDLVLQWAATRALAWGNNSYGEVGDGITTNAVVSVPMAVDMSGVLSGKTVIASAAGSGHRLVLCADGTLAAWGYNNSGQLGNGGTANSNVPVAVSMTGALSGKSVVAVAAGSSHSVALCADGSLAAWGSSFYGELGNGGTASSNVPVAVDTTGLLSGKTVVGLAAGGSQTLALCADGTLVAWGYNNYGQLGNGSTTPSNVPVAVNLTGVLAGKTVVGVAVGVYQSLALCTDGTLTAWGFNSSGQLGNASTTNSSVPVAVSMAGVLTGKTVVAIAAGLRHSLALCTDGTLAAWGENYNNQLGNGGTTNSSVPVAVNTAGVLSGKRVVAIAAGNLHNLASCADGTLVAWGYNVSGQLGNNSTTSGSVPVAVSTNLLAGGEKFAPLACSQGGSHSLWMVAAPYVPRIVVEQPAGSGLGSGSSTVDFGSSTPGTGIVKTFTIKNTGIASLTIDTVSIDGTDAADFVLTTPPASSVAEGSSTTFAVTFTAGMGFNRSAALHIVSNDPYASDFHVNLSATVPGEMTAVYHTGTEVPLSAIGFTATGSTVNLSLDYAPATGTTLTVVRNTGQGFINGTFNNLAQGQAVALSYGGVDYKFVANYYGGSGNDLVLQWASTRALAWGKNDYGQLGTGGVTPSVLPMEVRAAGVLAGKSIVAAAAGTYHSLVLCSDGTLAAWGYNGSGQLGNGSTAQSTIPVAVSMAGALAGKTVIAVAAGLYYSLALCSDGTLAAWGDNDSGQLGNGGTISSNVPVAVTTAGALAGKTVIAMAAGNSHCLALCADGTLAAWGSNSLGQLGNGSAMSYTTFGLVPVAVNMAGVLAGKTVIAVAAGNAFSLALCSDGSIATWGGSLTVPSNLPVALNMSGALAGKTVRAVAAGSVHSMALCTDGSLAAWGTNTYGQLGNGGTLSSDVPVAVKTLGVLSGKTVVAMAAGSSHSLVQCADGTLVAWGRNSDGQLGNGGTTDSSVPVAVTMATLAGGERFMAGITGETASHNFAIVATPLVPQMVVEQPAGTGLASGVSAVDFGSNSVGGGMSKTFTIRNNRLVPLVIDSVTIDGTNAADYVLTTPPALLVAAGSSTTFTVTFTAGAEFNRCATLHITSNDPYTSVFDIALNAAVPGVLAAAYQTGQEIPVTVSNFTATGSSVNFTLNYAPATGTQLMVVKNTGVAFITGTFSNLVQGQVVTLPFGGVDYKFVANYYGGSGNDLVLQWAAARAMAWGYNFYGTLGNGGTTDSDVPVAVNAAGVLAGKTVVAMAAGDIHSLALCSDGNLAAWGAGDYGLGNGSTSSSTVPLPVAVSRTGVLAGKTVVAMAAGHSFSLALCSDGRLAAWGANSNGQLGNGTTTSSGLPVAVSTAGALAGRTVVAVAAGYSHSLALCSDGKLVAWGDNSYNQLGNGGTTSSSTPVAVSTVGALAGKTVIAISARYYCNLALCSDGTLAAWGDNSYGQLGNGSTTQGSVPAAVNTAGVLAGKTVVAVSAGGSHCLALCVDGTLAAWGSNSSGQLGDGSTLQSTVPVMVNAAGELAGKTVVAATAGNGYSLARCADGTFVGWGYNNDGQLGSGSTASCTSPVVVSGSLLAVGEKFMGGISAQSHSLGIVAMPFVPRIVVEQPAATGLASGSNAVDFGSGTVGPGISKTFTIKNTGIVALAIASVTLDGTNAGDFAVTTAPAASVAAGSSTTFAVTFTAGAGFTRSATLHIASNDPYTGAFHLGLTATVQGVLTAAYNTGLEVPLNAGGFTATGSRVDLALNYAPVTGTALTVVKNTGLGFINGTFSNLAQGQVVALQYGGLTYTFVANYYGGSGNDLVLQWAAVRALAWGPNSAGQLGIGSTVQSNVPVAVSTAGMLAGKTVIAVTAGSSHSLALCADGTLAAWGYNFYGQLGNGTATYSYVTAGSQVPVAVNRAGVLSGKAVIALAAGYSHSLALCSDGTLAGWGDNSNGQLGNTTASTSGVPLAVSTAGLLSGRTLVAVAAGESHSLALCSDGALAAWGGNFYGQLGNGSSMDSFVPVAVNAAGVLAGKTVVAVAGGHYHSLALCSDGTLAAWGYNEYGQLGNGSTTSSNVPVAVSTTGVLSGKTVVAIAAGSSHNLVLCADGTLAAWGYNSDGELGNGTSTTSHLPVAVRMSGALAGRRVVAVDAGSSHSLAFCSDGTLAAWGNDSVGQLGDGNTTQSNVPVAVSTSAMAAGERFAAGTSALGSAHSLAIGAMPPPPQMTVEQPAGVELVNGSSTVDFSGGIMGAAGNLTFTLRNHLGGPLTISSVTFDGPNGSDFSLSRAPVGAVAAGSSTTFLVAFTPGAAGIRNAVMHIASNDPLSSPFNVDLTGSAGTIGTLAASYTTGEEIPLSANSFTATGVSVNFTLNFAPTVGQQLRVVENTGLDFIHGTFSNLAQGQMVALAYAGTTYNFVANYYGGSGNDLVLQSAAAMPLAWGKNTHGALGNNSTTNSSAPVKLTTSGLLSGKTVFALAAGGLHSLALCADGTLAAWGYNSSGQLGNGGTTQSIVPVAASTAGVLGGKTLAAVSAGTYHSLALCSDGTVAAWGYNSNGQLGNGNTTAGNVPMAVSTAGVLASKTVIAVCSGSNHNLALCSDGTVAAWGANTSGQLGNGNWTTSNVPVAVNTVGVLAGKVVVAMAAGGSHSLVLCSDGTLAAWGDNLSGQLGNVGVTISNVPVAVSTAGVLAGKTVVAVAAGGNHSLALCSDGTLAAWGSNSSGQLGDGSTTQSKVPVAVSTAGVLSGKTVVAICAGLSHSLALCADGALVAWGSNGYGQLGDNSSTPSNVPVLVSTARLVPGARFLAGVSGLAAAHSLGLVVEPPAPRIVVEQPAGTELADGASTVDFGGSSIGAAVTHTFTIKNTGSLGLSAFAVSFDGANGGDFSVASALGGTLEPDSGTTLVIAFTPTPGAIGARNGVLHLASNDPLASSFDVNLTGMAIGGLVAAYSTGMEVALSGSCFMAAGSTVDFALNYAPVTGTTLTVVNNTGPSAIDGTFNNLAQGQLVALTYAGVTYNFVANYYGGSGNDLVLQWAATRPVGWGRNSSAQLGDNTTTQRNVPVPVNTSGVLSGKTITFVSAGLEHSLALCSDGTLAAWGGGSHGQLGNGSLVQKKLPVAVSTAGVLAGKKVIAVSAGGYHNLALCSDGSLAAWGYNTDGQLGNGTWISSSSVPVTVDRSGVLLGKTVVGVAAGSTHSLALCSDGTVAAWGSNYTGELGNATASSSNVPVAVSTLGVLGGKAAIAVAAGTSYSLALCADGTVAAWGDNGYGQLGNGNTTPAYSPVAVTAGGVLNGRRVIAVAAGSDHSQALCADGTLAAWGANDSGQLGGGTTIYNSSVPVAVSQTGVLAGRSVVAVAAGGSSSYAVCADGSLAVWGANNYGQLGDTTTTQRKVPVTVDTSGLVAGVRLMAAAGGAAHSLALAAYPLPAATPQPATAITGATATLNGSVNARDNATTVTFEVGLDESYGNTLGGIPAAVAGTSDTAVSAALSGLLPGTTYHYRVVASSSGGVVRSAGMTLTTRSGTAWLAGLGLDGGVIAPVFERLTTSYVATVPFAIDSVTVTPATAHPGASVQVNGVALASGAASGLIPLVLGNTPVVILVTAEDGITTRSYTISVTRLPESFVFHSAGDVAVTANGFAAGGYPLNVSLNYAPATGTVLTMVNNTSLGFIQGTFGNLTQGQRIGLTFNGRTYEFVANYFGGTGNDLVLQWADTQVAGWGANNYGQLGDSTTTNRLLPTPVDATGVLAGKTITAVAEGYLHSLALCSDGTLAAWGYNVFGQLGNNGAALGSVPVAVDRSGALAGKTVVAIAAGPFHNLALCADGAVVAWGYNNYGQLGSGDRVTRRVPILVPVAGALAGKQVVAVAAAAYGSFALCADGTLAAWGYNDEGELGDGSKTTSLVPVAVDLSGALAGKQIASLSAGQYHTLSLCTDGTLVAWGYNDHGQLGNGSTDSSKTPVVIGPFGALGSKSVVAIHASGAHSLALCADGTLAAWGWNKCGQLGLTDVTQTSVPVAIDLAGGGFGAYLTQIAVGGSHSLARCADGAMVAWGDNANGQLGNNSTTSSAVPVAVDLSGLAAASRCMMVASGSSALHNIAVVGLPAVGVAPHEAWQAHTAPNEFDLIEQAFGLSGAGQLPQGQRIGDSFVMRFVQPAGVTGISYGAESSTTLLPGNWTEVPDTGSGDEHIFSVPASAGARGFLRLKVTGR